MLLIVLGYPDTDKKQYFDAEKDVIRGATLRGVRPSSCLFNLTNSRGLPSKEEVKDLVLRQAVYLGAAKFKTTLMCQDVKTQEYIEQCTSLKLDTLPEVVDETIYRSVMSPTYL